MYAGRGTTNSKAAEPGRPTALHRTAWEGSSNLIPFMRRKRKKARLDQKRISSAQTISSGLFVAAEPTGSRN